VKKIVWPMIKSKSSWLVITALVQTLLTLDISTGQAKNLSSNEITKTKGNL